MCGMSRWAGVVIFVTRSMDCVTWHRSFSIVSFSAFEQLGWKVSYINTIGIITVFVIVVLSLSLLLLVSLFKHHISRFSLVVMK